MIVSTSSRELYRSHPLQLACNKKIISTINVNGKVYPKEALAKEAVSMARELAKNARLLDAPLSAGTDFTAAQDKELQTQVRVMHDQSP